MVVAVVRDGPAVERVGGAADLTVDHVTPLAAGGAPFEMGNVAVLCRSCNSTKGASTDRGGVADRGTHTRPDRRASQREQQDRFIERHGLVDTGLMFQVAHSGTTVWRSPTLTEMLAEARAGAFDLLLTGYSDRWQRNLRRTLELLEDGLHPAGVALVMCDRRIVSSDPHDWDELVAEAAGAERYSRRLGERITDGYAAKFDHHDDRVAMPPSASNACQIRRIASRSTPP